LVRGRPSARLARGGRWAAAIVIASGCTSGSGHPAASGITDSPHPLAGQVRASPQLCSTFQPVAVSWTATRSGWLVLGRDCHRGQSFHFAYRLLHTTDAGKRWQPASIPSTRTNDGPEQIAFTADGVGYLFNTEHSWRTTDAAKQWLPMPGMHTEALSVDGAWTYRIGYTHSGCPGPCQAIVQRAATGTAEWQTLLVRRTSFGSTLATAGPRVLVGIKGSPAGGRPDAHTVLITSVDAGSSWRTRTDPCGGHGRSESDGYLSAVTAGGQVAVACSRRYQPVRRPPNVLHRRRRAVRTETPDSAVDGLGHRLRPPHAPRGRCNATRPARRQDRHHRQSRRLLDRAADRPCTPAGQLPRQRTRAVLRRARLRVRRRSASCVHQH
jgi:hypothetical protein